MTENDKDVFLSATKCLIGSSEPYCRLCINVIESIGVSLEEFVSFNEDYIEDEVKYRNMFLDIGIDLSGDHLPDVICLDCSKKVVASYMFKMFCLHSELRWKNAVKKLASCLPPDGIKTYDKSMYLFPNQDLKQPRYITTHQILDEHNILDTITEYQENIDLEQNYSDKIIDNSCNKSNIIFQTAAELRKHLEKVLQYKCQFCPKSFSKETDLFIHNEVEHNASNDMSMSFGNGRCKIYYCRQCKKFLKNKQSSRRHVCAKTQEYVCDLCGEKYNKKKLLNMHMAEKHNYGRSYRCKLCKARYVHKGDLETHMFKHLNELNFTCKLCFKVFSNRTSLKLHMRLHYGERPFMCEVCGDSFLTSKGCHKHQLQFHSSNFGESQVF